MKKVRKFILLIAMLFAIAATASCGGGGGETMAAVAYLLHYRQVLWFRDLEQMGLWRTIQAEARTLRVLSKLTLHICIVAGSDQAPGNGQWRIEKRLLSTGALDASFGSSGVVVNNPSGNGDGVADIAIDSQYMYVVGSDESPGLGNSQWRIEKRLLSTGALDGSFGTAGVVVNNPSANGDWANAIAIDSTYMYVAGTDNWIPGSSQWRIEKRLLSTGALDASFGTAGVLVINPSGDNDVAIAIAIDSTYMYVAGLDYIPGNGQWRIEKRLLSTGALDASFGTAGVVGSNPSTSEEYAFDIAIDSQYMYVAGSDQAPGNHQWRIEKRLLSTGALDASFGSSGVVVNNPSGNSDGVTDIAIDSQYMYVAGHDRSLGASNGQWRIEKRLLSTGASDASFGTAGVVVSNPSTTFDGAYAIAIASQYMYVAGIDQSLGNSQWRIEKRVK